MSINLLAQNVVPEARWESRADYKASEQLVITYMRDIQKDPVSDLKNREKSDYVMRWILGCPYVALKLQNRYFESILMDEAYHLADYTAYTLLFGEVLYYLENPFDRDRKNAFRSGIRYSMEVYKKLKAHDNSTTCKTFELFIRLDENNILDKFIILDDSN
ncbi:MAG: hypothetical protein ACPG3Z_06485 [Saprospiraceae bacterium]